jgi:hypothetical protein
MTKRFKFRFVSSIFCFLLILGFVLRVSPAFADVASLSVTPSSQTVTEGDIVTVVIHVNSGTDDINSVQANLSYPTSKLAFSALDYTGSAFGVHASQNTGGGVIQVGLGTTSPVQGSQTVVTVKFQAIASGSASLSYGCDFDSSTCPAGNIVLRSSDNADILTSKTGATVTVNASPLSKTSNNSSVVHRSNGETDVVSVGPNNALFYYFNALGSPNWGRLTISGSGTAYSKPVVIQRANGETDVVVVGPNYTLAGNDTPSVIQRPGTGETDIVVRGPSNELNYFFNALGSPNWGKLAVASNSTTFSAPALVQRPTGETNIAAQGPGNTLFYYFNALGSPNWGRLTVAGGSSAYSAPAMIQRPSSGETNITAAGPGNKLYYYFNALGSPNWGRLTVDNGNAAYNSPVILQRASGETNIVTVGPSNSLSYYYNALGSPSWGKLTVAGGNSAANDPSVIQRPSGETNIVVNGTNHELYYYFNAAGSPNWGRLTVAGAGSAY